MALMNSFWQNFALVNLILFVLYRVCWRFSGRNWNNFKNFLRKLRRMTLPEGYVIFRSANSVSNFKPGFCKFSSWFTVQNRHNVENLCIPWYQVNRAIPSRIQCWKEFSQFVNVLVSNFFHVTAKWIFQGPYCTFTKCSLSLTRCKVKLYSFKLCIVF